MKIENYEIVFFNEIPSTQIVAKEHYNTGNLKHGTVISALNQTDGYGRNGSQWIGADGNVALTVALNIKFQDYKIEQISYIAGVAIVEALKELDPNINLHLKWVNDVLSNSLKLSGILLEKINDNILLMGIGLNIKSNSQIKKFNSISLQELGIEIGQEHLTELLLESFKTYYNKWIDFGFAPIKNLWLEYAYGLGKNIIINYPNGIKETGIFEGINENGQLILTSSNGENKLVSSGELFFY